MKYHLGTPFGNTFFNQALLDTDGTKHILFTFADKSDPVKALETIRKYDNFTIIIDSGAFSAWNVGKPVNREQLLHYYQALSKYRSDLIFINLDVIPGERGRKPSKAEASRACEEGWKNYLYFKSKGLSPLPVFHEDDEWRYLEMMKNETDYIAISPANDSSRQRRMVWLDNVYSDLKANYKTHGLAATAEPLLQRYPFYSVDSINWKTSVMYGRGQHYDARTTSLMARDRELKYHLLVKDIAYYQKLQNKITDLWNRRGVTWQD